MSKKIIVYNRLSKQVLRSLRAKYDVQYFENINPKKDSSFISALSIAEGIIGLELQVDEELLSLAPHLKIVSNVSTGYNNLNIEAMTRRRVMASNTPDVLENTTADAVFGILLATARRIPELDQYVKKGRWEKYISSEHFGTDVHQKTIGIIGMGKIGSLVAKRANWGFDMKVLYYNRTRREDIEQKYNTIYCDLDSLLKKSDYICLMTPLTTETRNLIGEREFKLMKESCIFINCSRGETVDENALIQALKNKEISAAGLDVFSQEPVNSENPLLKFKNVITTPHIGSSTHETELNMSKVAANNLIAGLNNQCPPNLINKELFPSTQINS